VKPGAFSRFGAPLQITYTGTASANGAQSRGYVGFFSDFLSRKKIQEQAIHEARQFAKRLPRERVSNQKLLASEFEIAQGHLLGYRRQAKLGVYGTSSLINGFRWGLIDAGYDESLAAELSSELAVKLAAEK
jgi:hypothetical protein